MQKQILNTKYALLENIGDDILRNIRQLLFCAVLIGFGFLLSFWYNEQRPVQTNSCSCPAVSVTCEPVVKLYKLNTKTIPQTIPQTGVR